LHLRIASFEWLIWWCNSSIWLAQISPPFSWLSFFPPSYPMLREPIFKCDFETYHRAVEKNQSIISIQVIETPQNLDYSI
jgi:hypothetical protein